MKFNRHISWQHRKRISTKAGTRFYSLFKSCNRSRSAKCISASSLLLWKYIWKHFFLNNVLFGKRFTSSIQLQALSYKYRRWHKISCQLADISSAFAWKLLIKTTSYDISYLNLSEGSAAKLSRCFVQKRFSDHNLSVVICILLFHQINIFYTLIAITTAKDADICNFEFWLQSAVVDCSVMMHLLASVIILILSLCSLLPCLSI